MRHKHADLIHAWAEGERIQFRQTYAPSDGWFDYEDEKGPSWTIDYEYRIKPMPKPDVVLHGVLKATESFIESHASGRENIRLTFDGETGKLKSAEVL